MQNVSTHKHNRYFALIRRQFIVRQMLVYGGIMSLLGIAREYSRHFGWHLGFNSHFAFRAVAVVLFWMVLSYVFASWMWSLENS